MTEGKSDFKSAELVALADEVAAIACCGTVFMGDDEKLLKAAFALRRLAAQDQKPVAWRIRVVDGSYCEVIPKGELEIWKQNWSRHLESGHALLEPLCVGVSPPPAAGWDEGTLARAICHSDNGPGVPSCVMDDHPERDPCNFSNCRRFEQAREVINALHHNAPPDSGAGKSGDATGLIERDIAAQSALARIRKVRDGYANQAKFADVEQASYFREFIRRLDEAVGQKESVPQRVPDHGGADARVIDARWRTELDEIVSHLGAAITQSVASDDQIIMDHVKAAHEIAKVVRRQA